MTTTEDRYILASDLPGVAEAWGVWVGCCAEEPCHCDAQTLPEELDVTIPADAAFLCLTWGPRVDGRWPVVTEDGWGDGGWFVFRAPGTHCTSVMVEQAEDARMEHNRAHWLSLLNNPAALAAECRAVMEDTNR